MIDQPYPTAADRGAPGAPVRGEDPFYYGDRDGIDLRALLDILLRGKWIILGAVLALTIPVMVYSMLSPSKYRSYAILLVDKTDTDLADASVISCLKDTKANGAVSDDNSIRN